MSFIKPMLASPFEGKHAAGLWTVEEKFDGMRLIVEVGDFAPGQLEFGRTAVHAWSRDANLQRLPAQVLDALRRLPPGTYDGELYAPGKRSYGTKALKNADDLVLVLFDILAVGRHSTLNRDLLYRRSLLEQVAVSLKLQHVGLGWAPAGSLGVARVLDISEPDDPLVRCYYDEVRARDGEGLILKRADSLYQPGKRPRDWLKVKQLLGAVLTLTGFQAGKLGPYSVWILTDDEGHTTSVKWKNLALLAEVERAPSRFLKRRVRIEFQERTPDGSYRHPRFDRWAEEGE